MLSLICDQTGARTQDPRLKRALLYQLSYLVDFVEASANIQGDV